MIQPLGDATDVMGDHRDQSSDSRLWDPAELRQVPRELMKGRALLIWWSFEESSNSGYMTMSQRMKSWGTKIRHFFTRSRWDRCFQLIR